MGKWVNGFWDQETQLLGAMSEKANVRAALRRRGSRVQSEHAQGPGPAFHCFNTPMVLSLSLSRTQECFLMVALRTGFLLIITANLP